MNRSRAELIARLILERIGRVGDDLVRIRGETFRVVLIGNGIDTDTYDPLDDRYVDAYALAALVRNMDFRKFRRTPPSNINPNPRPMLPRGRPSAAPAYFPYDHPTQAEIKVNKPMPIQLHPEGRRRQ